MVKIQIFTLLFCFATIGHAAEPTQGKVEPFFSDKHAQKVDKVKITQNPDGTTTVRALLTYEDGQEENCTLTFAAQPVAGKGYRVLPKSRSCSGDSSPETE